MLCYKVSKQCSRLPSRRLLFFIPLATDGEKTLLRNTVQSPRKERLALQVPSLGQSSIAHSSDCVGPGLGGGNCQSTAGGTEVQQQGHFYAHAPMQAERKGILRPAVLRTQKSSTAQNPDLPGLLSLNRACSHHLHCSILNIPGFSFMYILHVNQPRLRFGEFSKAIQLSDPGTPTPNSILSSLSGCRHTTMNISHAQLDLWHH